jgi:hypothetical protein
MKAKKPQCWFNHDFCLGALWGVSAGTPLQENREQSLVTCTTTHLTLAQTTQEKQ